MDINLILHLIPLLAGSGLLAHPELSDADLQGQVVDTAWHALREALDHQLHAGFLVDLLCNIPSVSEMVSKAVASEIAKCRAQVAPPTGGGGSDTASNVALAASGFTILGN